jgi:type IV pilus assembly protein PilA
MLQKLRQRAKDEKGFTLIELLVVILIIGILAAIAIPSFLNQKGKANDANAKAVARTAQTAEETYFTDNQTYATTASALGVIETTLVPAIAATPVTSPHSLLVNSASGTGFDVSVISGASTPVTYHIINTGGTVTRSCTPASTGGCNANSSW